MTRVSTDEVWIGGWRGPSILDVDDSGMHWLASRDDADPDTAAGVAVVPGTLMPGFIDHHVHLGLIDPSLLVPGGIAAVVDLGSDPALVAEAARAGAHDPALPLVDYAGAFLTAPGGYPTDRSWAPSASIREIATAEDARVAIDEMIASGATRVKIALNATAGPVWDDLLLAAVIALAHARGLLVTAHAEGPGQALRAVAAGADVLAHTPFDGLLDDDHIVEMAARTAWTSTLDIHGHGERTPAFEIALDNLARFAAAGGRVLYGTDLGNGPLPVGLNPRELTALAEAGLSRDAIVRALLGQSGPGSSGPTHDDTVVSRVSWSPEVPPPADAAHPDIVRWLTHVTVLPVHAVEETFA